MSTLIGIYSSRNDVEAALSKIEGMGIGTKDISVVARETDVQPEGARAGTVAETAVAGAGTGAIIGGLTGLLVGVGAVTIPGIGALLVGGPIAAALGLTGAAATTAAGVTTGAVAGGLLGGLVGLGIPEDEARAYVERLKEGAIILAANVADKDSQDNVRKIFETTGANQIRTIS